MSGSDPGASAGGGILRPARRPAGWTAPGPAPNPPLDAAWLAPGPGEDLCWLAGDWRILQRTRGHRFSLDDIVTAHLALTVVTALPPERHLDLGCGIGSVLLIVAWRFPRVRCLGVEAQAVSATMARRSILWNGVGDRCQVRNGDLRDVSVLAGEPRFDLVTGTPPYFPPGTGVQSDQIQRAPCRFEHRGGIEAYCDAAAEVLLPGAPFVACAPAAHEVRVRAAVAASGLAVERWRDVVPRAGKAALVSVFCLRQRGRSAPERRDTLVVRDEAGVRTAAFRTLRAELGMP